MGTFFRFFVAIPIAVIVTALLLLGVYNQLSSRPFLYTSSDDPNSIYLEERVICYCGPTIGPFLSIVIPEVEPQNTWTKSEKAIQVPPVQPVERPTVEFISNLAFIENIRPCIREIESPLFVQLPPAYPQSCIKKGAHGSVSIQFDIATDGSVGNIQILETADACFDQTVITTVEGWRYQPHCLNNGAPTRLEGIVKTFVFKLID